MPSVLLIDSSSELRRLAGAILTHAGHVVREASDIRGAAALLRESPADVLVTDLAQPGRHAAETIEAIRRDFPLLEVVTLAGVPHATGCLRLVAALGGGRTRGRPFLDRETMACINEVIAGIAAHVAFVEYKARRQTASPRAND
jgi:CheY-like chemotaxis protein